MLNLFWSLNYVLFGKQGYWDYWSSANADGSSEKAARTAWGMKYFLRKGFPFQFILKICFLFRSALLCLCSHLWQCEKSDMVREIFLCPCLALLALLNMGWSMWPLDIKYIYIYIFFYLSGLFSTKLYRYYTSLLLANILNSWFSASVVCGVILYL